MVIGIIGGGASGMAAALQAAENQNAEIHIFERQARLGRKLLATGNGRCNLTNLHSAEGGYFGEDPDFARAAIACHTPEETLAWFKSLGLYTVAESTGRVYPYSDQANSVLDILRFALQKPNIFIHTSWEITSVCRKNGRFILETPEDRFACDKLIIACGGVAGSKLGGTMWGYKLLSKFGHKATKLRPALVQLRTDWQGMAALKGVRANCHAAIFRDDTLFSQSVGEIQFTENGISGPVIFEISRDVCATPGDWVCRLDLLPQMGEEELFNALKLRKNSQLPAEELLTGILHNRLGRVLVKVSGIGGAAPISALTDTQLQAVCKAVKGFEISLTEPMGMDSAQVTAGGVYTQDFNPETMESRIVPGLYACGEVLDIDGACGGYNLQWAWSSGRLAGQSAGGKQE